MVASSPLRRLLLALRTTIGQAALIVLLLAVGVAAWLAVRPGRHAGATGPAAQFDGPTMPAGLRAASFSLTDWTGRRVSLGGERGHVVVLTFLHSRCQDACPLTAEDIKGALNLLPAGARGVDVIAITAEPAQDTPAGRRAFLALHHMTGRMAYLNGPIRQLRSVWAGYHVLPVLPGKPDHTAFTLLIDKRGILRVGFPAEQMTPEALAHDIRVLQREHG
jgi:protein SCO1/2